jgi:hypothetical protein
MSKFISILTHNWQNFPYIAARKQIGNRNRKPTFPTWVSIIIQNIISEVYK